MTPNWFAVFALVLWPVVADCALRLAFFALSSAACLSPGALQVWRKFGPTEVLIAMCVAGRVVTSLLNGDDIYVGTSVLPGVGVYDGLSAALCQFIALVPFMLARQFLRGPKNTQLVFSALTLAGLAYSVLLLFEIRMSPQLHFWLYGYYPSDFIQEMREDGAFRSMVFMGHGLAAAFFAMTAAVAAAAIWRGANQLQSQLRRPLGSRPSRISIALPGTLLHRAS